MESLRGGKWLAAGIIVLVGILAYRGEFQVNTHTANDQKEADIAMHPSGDFVVVWYSYRQDGDSGGIFGRQFGPDGQPLGSEFQINTTTNNNQRRPAVAMDAEGNFTVVWDGPEENEEKVYGQRFDSNCVPVGAEFMINTTTAGRQMESRIAMNEAGMSVIVWENMPDANVPDHRSIYGRRYTADGQPAGAEFEISQTLSCRYPDVGIDESGEFVVAWVRESALNNVMVRRYYSDGSAKGLGFQVSTTGFTSLTRPAVGIDGVGNFFIAWDGDPNSYLNDDIYARRYHSTGISLSEQFIVNSYRSGAQRWPAISLNDDGHLLVVWQSQSQDGEGWGVFGQKFDSKGEPLGAEFRVDAHGDEFQINTYIPGDQMYPAIAMKQSGEFVVVWQSDGQDGSGYGIFGEVGPVIPCADFTDDWFVDFEDYCILAEEWLEELNPLNTDLVDDNIINGRDLNAFCEQWLRACYECNEVDIYADGKIDFKDYALLAGDWLAVGPGLEGDITGEGAANLTDLKAVLYHWLSNCQ